MSTETTCTACESLSRMGIKCNVHRTESRSAELVRKAREAGHDVSDGNWRKAERVLGARPVVIN